MRALFISSKYDYGLGGHAKMLSEQLQKRDHVIDLLRVPHIPITNLKNPSFAVLAAIKTLFTRTQYDIVHAFNVPSALPMRYVRAKKRVLSVHGVYGEQMEIIHSSMAGRLAGTAETRAFGWSDVLTTDSQRTAAAYRDLGYDFVYLPSAIDTRMFGSLAGIKKEPRRVAYVGRDSYEKGIDILRKAEPDIRGTVKYCVDLTWRDAMSTLASSSVMVLPSRMESLPTVIKEAFYLRVPVVAMSVGGVPELVEDGKTGFLVERHDTRRMTDVINGILDGTIETRDIVDNAYKYVTSTLTWDAVIPKYEAMYSQILSQ